MSASMTVTAAQLSSVTQFVATPLLFTFLLLAGIIGQLTRAY